MAGNPELSETCGFIAPGRLPVIDGGPFLLMISKRLLSLLLLSALLHALLLTLPGFESRPLAGAAGDRLDPRPEHVSSIFTIRLRAHEPVAPTLPSVEAEPKAEPENRVPEELPPEPVADPAPPPSAAADAGQKSVSAEAPLPILPDVLPRAFDRAAYLAAEQLDVRPTPLQPVVIAFDDASAIERERGQIVLVLFVGADGTVDLVDVDRSDVPPAVSAIVADTFRAARMRPGIKSERPVPARMKVLVEFEVR